MFQLINTNGSILHKPSVEVSTIKLPVIHGTNWYETCLFTEGDSDVTRRYKTLAEAVAGHQEECAKYKCENVIK